MAEREAPRGKPVEMVQVPLERLEALERLARSHEETLRNSRAAILDNAYEEWKRRTARSAAEKTQEIADQRYQGPQRFQVSLDSRTEDGKPGPKVAEHFPLTLRAHSDLEAQARYLEVMGIRKHDYRVVVEPLPAA